MSPEPFNPTPEQERVIEHERSAFVSACPGAGKTRVLVERARLLLRGRNTGKGIAFLSFTNAAVSELEQRLRQEGLLRSPAFPHFIGTFDSFLWQFLIAPFGVPGCEQRPRLIPDKQERMVRPYTGAQELPLECFDPITGEMIPAKAKKEGFKPEKDPDRTKKYIRAAASLRERFTRHGELDFADARLLAANRLTDKALALRLGVALSARFRELIVDEAQDCNPADLEIIHWLWKAGITTKVICDPNQSIYGFRGGVSQELVDFGQQFDERDRLTMSGNFRSSATICNAIAALRPARAASRFDCALGKYRAVTTPIHILVYSNAVPDTIGVKFREFIEAEGIDLSLCPVIAATRESGANAIGQPIEKSTKDLTLRLAAAVTGFYFAFEMGNRREALEEVHQVVLAVEGQLGEKTYHQYIAAEGLEPWAWRPKILSLVRELRYDPAIFSNPNDWHARAKVLLAKHLPSDGPSIAQQLRQNSGLPGALCVASVCSPPTKTIHAVKGMEFPAVCLVMTTSTTKKILDYLETGAPAEGAEEVRKIYVAASRAQRLLAIAMHKSQARRLADLLTTTNAAVLVTNI